jgi:hypothetical protein
MKESSHPSDVARRPMCLLHQVEALDDFQFLVLWLAPRITQSEKYEGITLYNDVKIAHSSDVVVSETNAEVCWSFCFIRNFQTLHWLSVLGHTFITAGLRTMRSAVTIILVFRFS